MPSVLDALSEVLDDAEVRATLGAVVGADDAAIQRAVDAGGPVLVGALADRAARDGGPAEVEALLDRADRSILDDVAGSVAAGAAGRTGTRVHDVPAGDRNPPRGADRIGAGDEAADVGGLGSGGDRNGAEILDDVLGGDRRSTIDGVAERAGMTVERTERVLGALAPVLIAVVARIRDQEGLDADGVARRLGEERAALGAGGARRGAQGDGADLAPENETTDVDLRKHDDPGGLAWLWWAIAAVALLLVLAWLLNQCSDGTETAIGVATTQTTTVPTTTEADPTDTGEAGDPSAGGSDADAEDGADDAGVGDGAADDADGAGEDGTDGAGDDATDGAGDDTTGGAGDDATGGAGDDTAAGTELGDAVDEVLPDGVTATVADGVVTLTGVVDAAGDRASVEAAVAAIDGVESVDNQIEVADGDATSDQTAAGGADGDLLNELLDLEPITFAYRSAVVTPEGEAVLDRVVDYLGANEIDLEIEGHTDSDGTRAENLDLSTRRAESVLAYLEGAGIDGGRLSAVGLGEDEPRVPNDSLDNKAINRRIELIIRTS